MLVAQITLWCDNIWLIAESRAHLEVMIADATDAINNGGFRWKPTSLQVMSGGEAECGDVEGLSCRDPEGNTLPFKAVERMRV